MTKHLVVLGFAKCGTSLLHEVFKEFDEFCTPIHKETNFFSMHWKKGLDHYHSKYDNYEQAESEGKIFFDSSPTYMGNGYLEALARIKATLGDSGKYVICLRNPIYRAFSHYKHQINAYYARYGFFTRKPRENFQRVYNGSFFDEETINSSKIFEYYFDKLVAAENILGKENIIYFMLENDIKKFDVFYRKVCALLEINYQPYFADKPLPRVLVGDYLSHYHYSKNKDLFLPYNNKLYTIKKGGLLLLNHRGNELFPDLSEQKVAECLAASNRWTNFLPGEVAQEMFNKFFARDCQAIEDNLGLDLSAWNKFKDKTSLKAEFSPQYVVEGVKKEAPEVSFQSLVSV
ncbi:MAG: sulfotransferase domain-containing protein [Cyanobacteria bacterium J06607_15]